jgi:DNA-binding transcriptional MerR regulator
VAVAEHQAGMSIGEAALRTGVSAHTLRYYEQAGLIAPVSRGGRGERRYAPDDLDWVRLLRRLRSTGMPIREVRRFAELRRQGDATRDERRALLEAHRASVAGRIAELERGLHEIDAKLARMDEARSQED